MRLLDLYCGAGGAAMGYSQAGFTEIVGVDLEPQPDYPFHFVKADALHPPVDLDNFDLIHASPPCQSYSGMSNRWGSQQPELIDPTRHLIGDRPYVIENVSGARSHLVTPVELTGEMFDLPVHRPRLFELGGWFTLAPSRPARQTDAIAVYGKPDGRLLWKRADGTELHAWSSLEEGQEAMGMPWVTSWHGIREAIPPAYTRWLGGQFIAQQALPLA